MTEKEFKKLTREFAKEALLFAETLPTTRAGNVIANQLARCASSVGANYRSACRAKSRKDMAAKLAIVLEEADESQYWLELAVDCLTIRAEDIRSLHFQANRIVGLCVTSIQTLRIDPQSKNRGTEESKIKAESA